jgi:RNA polymerase sigma-70 factor (ECF subfamily)
VNDTATLLGISVALVKVRLHRARMMLQKKLVPKLRLATKPEPKRRTFGRLSWL